jgi:Fe-S cluster assembly iron-binding protein IscA
MTLSGTIVDPKKVPTPEVSLTEMAKSQLQLLLENDFTLSGLYFRLLISGKGCDGFTYSVGFTDWHQDDLKVLIRDENSSVMIEILMDPFTAFYLQKSSIDYVQDFANNSEGFVITNLNQKTFSGKFWRSDDTKVPPLAKDLAASTTNA